MRPNRTARRLALLLVPLLASGCGVTRKLAVQSMTPILQESIDAAYKDRDFRTVQEGLPGSLLLLRGLCLSAPGNRDLWTMAVQNYFAFAMGFVEDSDPQRARLIYAEGMKLGREALLRRSWFRQAEQGLAEPDLGGLARLPLQDVPLLFWTVANWGSWIALNLESPEAVSQLPRIEAYLNRILELYPDYFLGMPHAMEGTMQTLRPVMFGGKPEEGRRHFLEAFRISGDRMLIFKVLYARYYCRQVLDEDDFDQTLQGVLSAPEGLLPEYEMFNVVAREKAKYLQSIRDQLF